MSAPVLSPCGEIVRCHDPDRFLTALFAPPARREALFVLYAFNHELARAREATSTPTLALIRLQWWREVVEGARRQHEVATPLSDLIESATLDRAALLRLIEAREAEAEPAIPDLDAWRKYLAATAGGLAAQAGYALAAGDDPRLRALGAAYGAAGLLRSVRAHARQGRCLLPEDVLAAQELDPDAVVSQPDAPALHPVLARLAQEARGFLREASGLRLPRRAIAAALPGVLARRDLRREPPVPGSPRGLGDRLAVLRAALTGHVC